MEKEINKKELRAYLLDRLENITSPVAHSYGYETTETAFNKLSELTLLAERFRLYKEANQLRNAKLRYEAELMARYRKSLKSRVREGQA